MWCGSGVGALKGYVWRSVEWVRGQGSRVCVVLCGVGLGSGVCVALCGAGQGSGVKGVCGVMWYRSGFRARRCVVC